MWQSLWLSVLPARHASINIYNRIWLFTHLSLNSYYIPGDQECKNVHWMSAHTCTLYNIRFLFSPPVDVMYTDECIVPIHTIQRASQTFCEFCYFCRSYLWYRQKLRFRYIASPPLNNLFYIFNNLQTRTMLMENDQKQQEKKMGEEIAYVWRGYIYLCLDDWYDTDHLNVPSLLTSSEKLIPC